MKYESCCAYKGGWWTCDFTAWKEQDENCYFAYKSASRPHCMHMREDGSCDNYRAQNSPGGSSKEVKNG